jgi:hypothetical protein
LRQLFVPRQWEQRVRQAVENHQEMERLIEELSDWEWKRVKERKGRLGSLHALEMTRGAKSWKAWLGRPLSSADSVGRVGACLDGDTLRPGIHHIYDRLKRNKGAPG